jgi:hypothetical protein
VQDEVHTLLHASFSFLLLTEAQAGKLHLGIWYFIILVSE